MKSNDFNEIMKAKNIISVRLDEDSYNDLVEQANDDSVTITEKCREHIENGISGSSDEQEPIIKRIEVPVEKIVEKRVEIAPNYLPRYECSQGLTHNNKNYSDRVKSKCYNCDQFNKKSSGKCSWCGSNDLEPIDKDELKDKGIPLPNPYTPLTNNCTGLQCSYQTSNHLVM